MTGAAAVSSTGADPPRGRKLCDSGAAASGAAHAPAALVAVGVSVVTLIDAIAKARRHPSWRRLVG